MDTTIQNRLNIEKDKVLYNTVVTHAALNMDWLATAELLDDKEHTLESRLKFWYFDLEKQTYVLNTQVELPHENGVRALEFSTPYPVENLICASSGLYDVKVWALEDSESIYSEYILGYLEIPALLITLFIHKYIHFISLETGKIWTCIGQTTYKDLPIDSLSFSSDTSLLSVGFGNTLCVYTSETLHLKCALSAPAGLDGSTNKLTITLPTNSDESNIQALRSAFVEKRRRLTTLLQNLIENNDTSIMKHIDSHSKSKRATKNSNVNKLTLREQKLLFKNILANNSLDLFQKINLFDRMNLRCRALIETKHEFQKHFELNNMHGKDEELTHRLINLSPRHRFMFCNRLNQFKLRKSKTSNLAAAYGRTIRFYNKSEPKVKFENGRADSEKSKDKYTGSFTLKKSNNLQPPLKSSVQIKHVAFCTGEYAHLVIACTENRVLIWNLLTLRLQSSLKLCVSKIVVDLYTSLVAVFTNSNELIAFLPNTPIPLCQHKNLPKVHGAAWIPRKYPKSHSLNVDWQAISELFFLTEKQVNFREFQ